MKYDEENWPTPKCILCLSTDSMTKEHLIPACLGGNLTAKFLCKDCNSGLGQGMESKVKEDPQIRLGIERLADARPELANRLRKRLDYIGHSQQGSVSGYLQDGVFSAREQTLDDRSIILPPDKSLDAVKKMAARDGIALYPDAADTLDRLSSGDSVQVAPGGWITNWTVNSVDPDLSGSQMDLVVPTKIAFEFLALHCGNDIYKNPPQLASIRHQLLAGELSKEDVHVERLMLQNDRLFHGLVFEGNSPGAQVQIRLFGQLAFRVQFRHLAIHCPRYGYTHDLVSGKDGGWRAAGDGAGAGGVKGID